jgi:uncharacterized protein
LVKKECISLSAREKTSRARNFPAFLAFMPIHTSRFHPPWPLRSGHAATILSVFMPSPDFHWAHRQRHELPDGDFLDYDHTEPRHGRLALLSHGLEGSSQAIYIRQMAAGLSTAGWDVWGWNYRGCSGVLNRRPHFYHSGATDDLHALVEKASTTYPEIVLIGFSLGGNLLLKYLGERAALPEIKKAVAISAPVDLASSARAIDQRRLNIIYQKRFLRTLKEKIAAKAQLFPHEIKTDRLAQVTTLSEFDDFFTAPLHGFASAADYWEKCSAQRYFDGLRVPALLLNAKNDPILDTPSFPDKIAAAHDFLTLEMPAHGGHVGFIDLEKNTTPWFVRRTLEYLAAVEA